MMKRVNAACALYYETEMRRKYDYQGRTVLAPPVKETLR